MAVQDNLKIAVSSVRRAVDDLKREINDLRRGMDEKRRGHEALIAQRASEIKQNEAALARTAAEDDKRIHRTQIQELQRQIHSMTEAMRKEQQVLSDTIKAKESGVTTLDTQARNLESQGGLSTGLL